MKLIEFLKWLFDVENIEDITDAMVDDFLENYSENAVRKRKSKKAWDQPVKIVAVGDEKTCPTCRKLNGKVFRRSEAKEILATKTHPNCRCKIVSVKK